MKRKIYDKLLEWKKTRAGSSAVMIDGARRVGKVAKDSVTIVKHYAKKLSEKVCEVAKRVKEGVTRTLTTVAEAAHKVYDVARTAYAAAKTKVKQMAGRLWAHVTGAAKH